jgi:hypothetical protein
MKDFLGKIFASVLGLIIASIPFDLYLLAKYFFNPQGFWQNLVLAGLGLFFLGLIQLGCLILLVVWLVAVWTE